MNFLKKFASAFAKLFGHAPTWIHTAQTVIAFIVPIVTAVLQLNSPDTLAVATPIINEVKTDLATLSVLAGNGDVTPTLPIVIGRVQDNLQALLAVGHVKDEKLTANINLAVGELNALAGMLPTPAVATA